MPETPPALAPADAVRPLELRPITLGFRAHGVDRDGCRWAQQLRVFCRALNLPHDIDWSADPALRDWLEFLQRCRAVLAVAADDTGKLARPVFDAVAARTALVLLEGTVPDLLRPDEHYLPLRRDFSNVAEVLQRLDDLPRLGDMTARAFAHVARLGTASLSAGAAAASPTVPPRAPLWQRLQRRLRRDALALLDNVRLGGALLGNSALRGGLWRLTCGGFLNARIRRRLLIDLVHALALYRLRRAEPQRQGYEIAVQVRHGWQYHTVTALSLPWTGQRFAHLECGATSARLQRALGSVSLSEVAWDHSALEPRPLCPGTHGFRLFGQMNDQGIYHFLALRELARSDPEYVRTLLQWALLDAEPGAVAGPPASSDAAAARHAA